MENRSKPPWLDRYYSADELDDVRSFATWRTRIITLVFTAGVTAGIVYLLVEVTR